MILNIFNPNLLDQRCLVNERAIELALGNKFLETYSGNINLIEVGATMPTYFQINHLVLDPYDPYEKCIRQDAETYDLTGRIVLSISTIENMGRCDYGNDLNRDPDKAIRFLEKMRRESDHFLITFPVGGNPELDTYVVDNHEVFINELSIYHRIYYSPPLWQLSKDINIIKNTKYGTPFPNGNAIVVLER